MFALVAHSNSLLQPTIIFSNVLVSSTTKDNNNDDDDEKKELHNYEVVGPALPPSRKPKESPEKKSTDISLTVHNVLYSKDEKDSGSKYLQNLRHLAIYTVLFNKFTQQLLKLLSRFSKK